MNSSHIHAPANAHPRFEAPPTKQQFLTSIILSAGAGVVAALCSSVAMGAWYRGLIKPVWAPAEWLFAPLQILIFALAGIGLAYLSASQAPAARKKVVLNWFWAQLILSISWAICFFILHAPAWAYTMIMLWWCAVFALLWTGSRLSRRAFWFLTPLFFWVTFASSLTFAILSFNVLRQASAGMDSDPRNRNSPAEPPIIVRKR
ncbi:tryptophan-rich sensory protein [bacterium]|nr:MAG: tryptophan-rich sensory protein [bacterium]